MTAVERNPDASRQGRVPPARAAAVEPERLGVPSPPRGAESLAPAFELALEWAGRGCRALVLSGSHAAGDAVWAEVDGRRVCLSDLDLYAVQRDSFACRNAEHRARRARPGLASRCRAWGLLAPLEVAFVTGEGFASLPARPGTLELARHGVVVTGDRDVLSLAPQWTPRDVSAEERLLLLENRAFELLAALPSAGATERAAALRSRHGVLKVAVELAGVMVLEVGEWPDGAPARIARARELLAFRAGGPDADAVAAQRMQLWDAALAWKAGAVETLEPAAARAEWSRAVSAWCAEWERFPPAEAWDPWTRARRRAARATLRRRVRRALEPAGRTGAPLASRLRYALAGTPQHRANASAAVLLLAASASRGAPALPAGALHALHALGVTRAESFAQASRDVVRAWDHWVLDGQRTAEEE